MSTIRGHLSPPLMANILPSRPRQSGLRRNYTVIAGQYNARYVDAMLEHFRREMDQIAPGSNILIYRAPGAFEIPLMVQEVAERGSVDAVIALGVIIEGETAHADLIGRAVTESLLRTSLATRIPVVHEVLLLRNEEQAQARCLNADLNRGTEAARVAVKMVQSLLELRH